MPSGPVVFYLHTPLLVPITSLELMDLVLNNIAPVQVHVEAALELGLKWLTGI